jgi:hypothetical protein
MFKGMVEGYPKNWKLPKKLILNNFFNAVGRSSARFGNASACASKKSLGIINQIRLDVLFHGIIVELLFRG